MFEDLDLAELGLDRWIGPYPGNPCHDVVVLACESAGFQPRLEADVARLKAEEHLHPDVQVSSVLFSLDPSPSVERRRASVPHLDKQLVKIQDGADARSNRYFRDGLLELFVRADPNGTPRYIDYFNSERHRVRREEMDQSGRTVRVVHYPTAPNTIDAATAVARCAVASPNTARDVASRRPE